METQQNYSKYFWLVGGGIIAIWLLTSIVVIPAGHIGVILQFGRVTGRELSPGLNFKIPSPFQATWVANTQIQKEQVDAQAASADLQVVHSNLALNYHLDPTNVGELYSKIGTQYKTRIIDPAIQEVFKATTAKYTAAELLTKRAEVKDVADKLLMDRLQPRGVVVDDLSIVNFDFSEDFNKAIEAKQVAQQEAEKAQYKLQQAKLDAQSQQAQKVSLTQEILTKMFLEKWNGVLPQYMGTSNIFGIQVQK